MQKQGEEKPVREPQSQPRPGDQSRMSPAPKTESNQPGSGRLAGKVALITGGDSGIGRAVAEDFHHKRLPVLLGNAGGTAFPSRRW